MPSQPVDDAALPESAGEALNFARAELDFVYREIHKSLELGQNVMRWGFTVYGVLLGAALATEGFVNGKPTDPVLDNAVWLVIADGIPAVIWASAIAWMGEHARLVRAARYLARLEDRVASIPGLEASIGFRPLRWQRWVLRDGSGCWNGLIQKLPYIGVGGAYVLAALIAHVLAFRLGDSLRDKQSLQFPYDLVVWFGAAESIAGAAICFVVGVWLYRRHSTGAAATVHD